jgi:hypothetical protein
MKSKVIYFFIFVLIISLLIGCKPSSSTAISTSPSTNTLAEEELLYPEIPRISAEEVKNLINKKSELVIVDTREESVFAAGHITGAINIHTNLFDPFAAELKIVGLPKNTLIVFYCD